MANFKIGTYNCKNFNGDLTVTFVSELFNQCDFLCIYEHHMYASEFDKFDELDEDGTIMREGTSVMDPTVLLCCRKHDGTMIIWKGNIRYKVTLAPTVSKRRRCLEINLSETVNVLLFSVYMPCDERRLGDNLVVYQDILSEIAFISEARYSSYIFIVGNLNTDFSRNTPQRWELSEFCNNECIVLLCKQNVSTVEYTYESV